MSINKATSPIEYLIKMFYYFLKISSKVMHKQFEKVYVKTIDTSY